MGYFDEGEKLGRSVCIWGVVFILGGLFDAGLAIFLLASGLASYVPWIIAGVVVFFLAISCWVAGGVGIAAGTKKKTRLAQAFFFLVLVMLALNIASIIAVFMTSQVYVWTAYWMIFDIIMIGIIAFQGFRYWRYLKNGGSSVKSTNTVIVVAPEQAMSTTTVRVVQNQSTYVPPQPQPIYSQQPPPPGQPMYIPPQQPMYTAPPPGQSMYTAPPPGQPMYQPPPGQPMYQPPPQGQPQYYAPPPQDQTPTY